MSALRFSLAAVGVGLLGYGAYLLNHWQAPSQLVEVGIWAVIGVVVHDAVLAPIVVLLGWISGRWLRGRSAAAVAIGFALVATLTVSGFAVLARSHGGGENHTLLDRDYPLGLLVATLVIVACVAIGYGVSALKSRRGRRHHGASTGS